MALRSSAQSNSINGGNRNHNCPTQESKRGLLCSKTNEAFGRTEGKIDLAQLNFFAGKGQCIIVCEWRNDGQIHLFLLVPETFLLCNEKPNVILRLKSNLGSVQIEGGMSVGPVLTHSLRILGRRPDSLVIFRKNYKGNRQQRCHPSALQLGLHGYVTWPTSDVSFNFKPAVKRNLV